ncbi:MAG: ABC transporter substrate-binding protein [Candidatus Dormibacteraeota bacterium]|nr:ABC transporter substrate-binding protein [Candidatus Dormibacteraeota bacterium]
MTPGRQRLARGRAVATLAAVLVLGLAGGVLALGGVGSEQPLSGGAVREALVVDGPLSVLPPFAETVNSRDLSGLLYRGLTRTGADARPVGELARDWSVDTAARTFTFRLRRGLRWSDGAPITSADALFTLSVLQSDADARSATGQAWSGIGATAPDAFTVVYTLPQSSAAFLALTSIGLLPEHSLAPRAINTLRQAVDAPTSGPFRLGRLERDRVTLERNPHAFERPYVDGLELHLYDSRPRAVQALLAGEVDVFAGMTGQEARRVSAAVNRRVIAGSTFTYSEILLNQRNDALADERVRHAIGLAIDRPGVVAGPLAGYAVTDESPIPPAISWAAIAARGPEVNRVAAARQLDAAGWHRAGRWRMKDGHRLQLRLATVDAPPYTAVAARVEDDLASMGIATIPQPRSQEALVTLLQSALARTATPEFDMALTAVDNGPDPDIYVFWHSSQAGPGGFNFSGMAPNEALDRALETGRSTSDYKVRRGAYLDAQKLILAAHPAVFLYSPQALVGARDAVKGIRLPTGGARYDLVQEWYLLSQRRL